MRRVAKIFDINYLQCYNAYKFTLMLAELEKTASGGIPENLLFRVPKVQGVSPESLRQKDGTQFLICVYSYSLELLIESGSIFYFQKEK